MTKLLAVDLEIDGTPYYVNSTIDLKSVLPEQVAVGFSAATGSSAELHRVLSWSFDSTLGQKSIAPAPAPQPVAAPEITPEPSAKLVYKVLVPVLAVSVCAIIVGLLLWAWQRGRRNANVGTDSESDEQRGDADFERGVAGPRRFRYRDLAAATDDFVQENMLGRGGFGSVYKGRLPRSDIDGDGGEQGGSHQEVLAGVVSEQEGVRGRGEDYRPTEASQPCAALGLV